MYKNYFMPKKWLIQTAQCKQQKTSSWAMLTTIQLQNLDQTSANIVILLIWSKRNKRITSCVLWNVRARASYTCEHVLHACASTCLLHVRARYLFVRARLLFKNVRPGQLKRVQNYWPLEYYLQPLMLPFSQEEPIITQSFHLQRQPFPLISCKCCKFLWGILGNNFQHTFL